MQELFTYDPSGNRTLDNSIPTGLTFGTTEFYYNSRNRLETVILPDGRTAAYTYDPFGRRIKKIITPTGGGGAETTYYAYSDEGLIGEYDANGSLLKAYGWIPNTIWGTASVFMFENGNYFFFHNDHLGTPQWMSDVNGAAVWSAKYTAFGSAEIQIATIKNNLRFPGQYYDSETGLHYNWNRYYDPRTGRYTQEDPIGFGGEIIRVLDYLIGTDINLYRYVLGNPVNWLDPSGLFTVDNVNISIVAAGVSIIEVGVVFVHASPGMLAFGPPGALMAGISATVGGSMVTIGTGVVAIGLGYNPFDLLDKNKSQNKSFSVLPDQNSPNGCNAPRRNK